ncbi:MAG: cell wall hydrolase [Lachnospiraceae bacterium]|nr:cell wall hydrolase [Lachnospiraceae bacterium]
MKREGKRAGGRRAIEWFIKILLLWMTVTAVLCSEKITAAAHNSVKASWKDGAGIAALIDKAEFDENAEEQENHQSAADTASDDTEIPEGEADNKEEQEPDNAAGNLVMADVNNVLNVRTEPDSSAELAGYLYADCGGTILQQQDGWTKLESGELVGWASNDYLLFGEEAKAAAEDSGRTVATTTTGALRIRKEPSLDAGVYDLLEEGAEYEVVDADQLAFSDGITISEDWIAVDYEGKTGFVSSEYVKIDFLVDHGETVEEVKQRKAEEEKAALAAKKEKQKQQAEKTRAMEASDEVLLAALIQCEAGSDIYEGQVAVGAVVMNRVKSPAYPNTIKDVIFASGQFTPVGSGKVARLISSGKIRASCVQAAQEAIAGVSPVGSATHFRRAGSREGLVVGAHVFW